jgi:hypothetical protein
MAQLFVVITFFAWVVGLIGYGAAMFNLLGASREPASLRFTLFGAMGFLVLSSIGTIANYFVPLNPVFAAIVLAVGWFLFLLRWRVIKHGLTRSDWLLAGLFLLTCATLTLLDCHCNDTGIYHLQAINWLQRGPLVWGLARINPYLGLNFSWFTVSAIVQPPRQLVGGVFFLANPMLLFFFGVSLLLFLRQRPEPKFFASSIFILSAAIPLVRAPWRRFIFSPSPDLPAMLLVFLVLYLMIRWLEEGRKSREFFALLLIFASYGLTVKLSTAPLLAAPLVLAVAARLKAHKSEPLSLGVPLTSKAIVAAILLPWALRGLALSGGVFYPSGLLFFPNLPWAVSPEVGERMLGIIGEWTRHWSDPTLLRTSSGSWLIPWLVLFLKKESLLVLLAVTAVSLLGSKKGVPTGMSLLLPPFLVALAGVTFWFVTAPDPRLGYGFLFSTVSLLWIAGLFKGRQPVSPLFGQPRGARLRLIAQVILALGLVCGVIVVFSPADLSRVIVAWGISPSYRGTPSNLALLQHYALFSALVCLGLFLGISDAFAHNERLRTVVLAVLIAVHTGGVFVFYRHEIADLRNVPPPTVVRNKSPDGAVIYVGICWDAPLPCTPIYNPELEIQGMLQKLSAREMGR